MKAKEPYSDADWRCNTVVRIAATTNVPKLGTLQEGTIGKAIGIVDYMTNQIAFSIPNATALFLNLSKKYYVDSVDIAESFSTVKSISQQVLDDEAAFAYLESIMASIVFSYTALESFANEEIPDDFVHTIDKNKFKEVYNKTQIERFLGLNIKLGDILPIVCNVPSPKGSVTWQNFKTLETLRHGIIHMKKSDREHIGYSSQSVWSKLIQKQVPATFMIAKDIIDHFYKQRAIKPHWYQNMPF